MAELHHHQKAKTKLSSSRGWQETKPQKKQGDNDQAHNGSRRFYFWPPCQLLKTEYFLSWNAFDQGPTAAKMFLFSVVERNKIFEALLGLAGASVGGNKKRSES